MKHEVRDGDVELFSGCERKYITFLKSILSNKPRVLAFSFADSRLDLTNSKNNKEALVGYFGFHDLREFWRTLKEYLRSRTISKKQACPI
jgi:hypothetical protein